MTYFFNNAFLEALRADPNLLNNKQIKLFLFTEAPIFQQDDSRYLNAHTIAELEAMPGWRRVTTTGHPFTHTMQVSTVTKGQSVYVLFPYTAGSPNTDANARYPFTGLGRSNVKAISFVYSGSVGGVTDPVIFTTNRMMSTRTRLVELADGDSLTAHPDYAYSTTVPYRWLFSWALPSAGDPGVLGVNRLDNSEFDGLATAIQGHGGMASGWLLGGTLPAVYNLSLQPNGINGAADQYQRVTADLTAGTSIRLAQRVLAVYPNRGYATAVQVKGNVGSATATLVVDELDQGGNVIAHHTQNFSPILGWTPSTLNFTTLPNASSAVAWVEVAGTAAGVSLDVDKFYLNEQLPATVRPVEGPLNVVKGMPPFEAGHVQHVWIYPQRVNYIANPSFEVAEVTPSQWASNGAITRVSGGGPGGGSWSGQFDGSTPVIVESNRFPCTDEQRWTVQLMAKGTGKLRVGLVYWDSTYEQTAVDWGDTEYTLDPQVFIRIATIREVFEAHEAMLRLECNGSPLIIDRVLVEKGTLMDWWYFDGNTTYGAKGDFSWYGGPSQMGKSFSLWYNNKSAVLGRLFAWDLGSDQLVTDEEMAKQGFVYQWVPAGIYVKLHYDVLYPGDQTDPLPPKGPILPYKQSTGDDMGVTSPWTATAVDLTVQSVAHSQTADGLAMTTVDAGMHAMTADSVTLGLGASNLAVNSSAHGQSAEQVAFCEQVLSEPFSAISSAWATTGSPTIVPGRTGGAVKVPNFSATMLYTVPAAAQSDTITVGVAVNVAGMGSEAYFMSLNSDAGATEHIALKWNTFGAIGVYRGSSGVGASANGVLATNTWAYVEVQCKLHDTAGTLEVRVNGSTVIGPVTTDTRNGGTKTVFDSVKLAPTWFDVTYDDMYVSAGGGCQFKGNQLIAPAADVLYEPFNNLTAWTLANTPVIVAGGRTGNMVEENSSSDQADYALGSNKNATVVVGFAFKTNNLAAGPDLIRLLSDAGATLQTRLIVQSNGSLLGMRNAAGLGTASAVGLIAINTWYYVEVKAVLHDTTGSMVVNLNGTQVLNYTNVDTRFGGTDPTYDTVEVRHSALSTTAQWDDMYIAVGAGAQFKGPITIP